jgi:hypothetical protein
MTLLLIRDVYVFPSYLRFWLVVPYKPEGYVPPGACLGPSLMDPRLFGNLFRTDGAGATFAVVPVNGGGYNPRNQWHGI